MKHLLLSTLLIVSTSALAVNTIKSTKSNASEKVNGTCTTTECCAKYPNAPGCVGSVLRVNCPQCKPVVKPSAERDKLKGSTKTETGSTTSFKPGAPAPTAPVGLVRGDNGQYYPITVSGSKSNSSDKEVAPTPGPTPKPAESSNINSSRSNKD